MSIRDIGKADTRAGTPIEGQPNIARRLGSIGARLGCASLLQFPEVRRLALHGRLTNLPAPAGLRHLTGLRLRFNPDLTELPALTTRPGLEHVTAWNVDAVAGEHAEAARAWFDTERDF